MEELIELQKIRDLLHRYGSSLDDRDWERLRSCFIPEAVAIYGEELGRQEGYPAIERACRGALEALDASHHIITNHEIEIEGDQARSRCYLQAQHTKKGTPGGDNFTIGAVYRDRLVKTEAGWRIAQRELKVIWEDGNPAVLWGDGAKN